MTMRTEDEEEDDNDNEEEQEEEGSGDDNNNKEGNHHGGSAPSCTARQPLFVAIVEQQVQAFLRAAPAVVVVV